MDIGFSVFSHNIETIERLTSKIRDIKSNYWQTIRVLDYVKRQNPSLLTKNNIRTRTRYYIRILTREECVYIINFRKHTSL